ncbi:MAG: glycogen synthase GlgA [Ignavibacteriales bacterium]|nr:glycogen synthase GlgA [Ignavibacteriales bacterium]
MNILFVSSEVEPFSKTGGLADVSGALPKALQALGHDVRVVTPQYRNVDVKKHILHLADGIGEITQSIGDKTTSASIMISSIGKGAEETPVYFIANKYYFDRDGLYSDTNRNADYPDNDERFIFFSKVALELCKRINFRPHIIHCNDWQSALICPYLKLFYAQDSFFAKTKTVFTIHNLAYQGVFGKNAFENTGLPNWTYDREFLEFYGCINFMKAGIVFADAITTVSKRYAEEICSSEEFGNKLEGLLRKRKNVLFGILNGIDTTIWNPAVDKLIPARFDMYNLEAKYKNKESLIKSFRLPHRWNVPIIGIISRLVDQKGFDIIAGMAHTLLQHNVQMIILGSGEPKYERMFSELQKSFGDKVGVYLGFNNEMAHLIEAGSDMFLMPSKYEPCGLNQMYSLKYGTVPIVRATGGLDDTIENVSENGETGTGFKFWNYTSGDLYNTIMRALAFYQYRPDVWRYIVLRGMAKDYSWEKSARDYEQLYKMVLLH